MNNRKIKEVSIKNFQSHKDSTFKFSERLNAFQGLSGNGKSVVLKALEWLIYDKVVGEQPKKSIHSNWIKKETKTGNLSFTGTTAVKVTFSDDISVERNKGKINNYVLSTLPKPITGAGAGTPSEVKELFGFTDLNIESQAESYFLLFESPAKIAKKLGEVCDLSLGDKLLTKIKSETRSVNSKKKFLEEAITEIEDELLDFALLDTMEKDLKTLDKLTTSISTMKLSLSTMNSYVDDFSEVEKKLEEFKTLDEQEILLNSLTTLQNDSTLLADKVFLMESYIDDFKYLQDKLALLGSIKEEEDSLEELTLLNDKRGKTKANYDNISYSLNEFRKTNEEIKLLPTEEERIALDDLIETLHRTDELRKRTMDIASGIKAVRVVLTEQETAAKELHLLEKEVKEAMGDICPLCGTKIEKESL